MTYTQSLQQLRQGQVVVPATAVASLDPPMALLRTWQMARLAQTHADLLASPRYGQACRFFLSDVYAPHDFSRRDASFQVLYDALHRYLPASLLNILSQAISLNELTQKLDQALLVVLVEELGMTEQITPALCAEAYRRCNNYAVRVRQLELLIALSQEIYKMVQRPLTDLVLHLAHHPAHRLGWGEVQDFLERGFAAFKQMAGGAEFLDIIYRREQAILDRIYAYHPDPFSPLADAAAPPDDLNDEHADDKQRPFASTVGEV